MKVVTVVGTRPEIIRLSRVIAALERYTRHILVHTGQNYDYELNQVFFDDLELRAPDHFLEAAGNYYKPGVTTSPQVIRAAVKILREFTPHIAIVETDGGYGAWQASEAFAGHGMNSLSEEFGVEIVNLNEEPRQLILFRSGRQNRQLPLPTRLLHETDVFITMPVPKIHCMTGLTLAYKNQWGCIPNIMRLRVHYIFALLSKISFKKCSDMGKIKL
jgi:hypothetical protein